MTLLSEQKQETEFRAYQRHKTLFGSLTPKQRVWVHELLHAVSGLAMNIGVKEVVVHKEGAAYGGYCEFVRGHHLLSRKGTVTTAAPQFFFAALCLDNDYEKREVDRVWYSTLHKDKILCHLRLPEFRDALYTAAKAHWRKSKLTTVAECPLIQKAVAILKQRRRLK
jgi:hypothetical protein